MASRGRPRILTDEERTDKKFLAQRYKCANRDRNFKWILANPEKYKAHRELTRAIKAGETERPGKCSSCGKKGKIHGHHEDYSKPLAVTWLCSSCHQREHRPPKKVKIPKPKMSTAAAIALVLGRVR